MRLVCFAVDTSCIRTALCATAIVATGLQFDARVANAQVVDVRTDASSQDVPPADVGITLERVVATGDACPARSYTAKLSDDGKLFSIQFSKFRPRITPDDQTVATSCRLAIVVTAPVGTSFQVEQVSFSGYGYLEEGVQATITTTYYFQADQSRAQQLQSSFTGPYDSGYTFDDKPADTSLWSPCGTTTKQTLNIQLHTGLANGTPARDGTFELNNAVGVALRWRRCDVMPTTPQAPTTTDVDDDMVPESDQSASPDEDGDIDSERDHDDDSDGRWWWAKATPVGRVLAFIWRR